MADRRPGGLIRKTPPTPSVTGVCGMRLVLSVLLLLAGCKDRFRYECQDPDNWNIAECQKPKCVASGYCTEYLIATGETPNEAAK